MRFDLQGKHVLVTGGTRGIGRELVCSLLTRGARVTATGRDLQRIEQAARDLPAVQWITCDLEDPASRAALARQIQEPLHAVIHNAGVQELRDFLHPDEESISVETEIDVNLLAPIELTRLLLPLLRQVPHAALVYVTSGLALAPKQSSPVYCATKAGLRSFSKALRGQIRQSGAAIEVIEALPPIVDTDMTRGRGSRKMSAQQAAAQILDGLVAGRAEIYVGASKALKWIMRLSPRLGESIMIAR